MEFSWQKTIELYKWGGFSRQPKRVSLLIQFWGSRIETIMDRLKNQSQNIGINSDQ
jgi:hypothetical protein